MKVSGWVYSSLDINHGQHSYNGNIKNKKVAVSIDLGHKSCKMKGRIDGKCTIHLPHVKMPKESIKKENPEYYQRLKDEAILMKSAHIKIVTDTFDAIKKAAAEKGLTTKSMQLKIKS